MFLLSFSSQPTFTIGRDPTFYPLDLKQKNDNVNAFINALFEEIGNCSKSSINIVNVNAFNLLPSLEGGSFDGVITAIDPDIISKDKYHFSLPLLKLGPVLVTRNDSKIESLKEINGKTVAISPYNDSVYIVQKYPSLYMQYYENMAFALEDLANGKVEAALVDYLEAKDLVPYLYRGRLKISSSPLNQKGIRLVTLKSKNKNLIVLFNKQLRLFKKNSTIENLQCLFDVN